MVEIGSYNRHLFTIKKILPIYRGYLSIRFTCVICHPVAVTALFFFSLSFLALRRRLAASTDSITCLLAWGCQEFYYWGHGTHGCCCCCCCCCMPQRYFHFRETFVSSSVFCSSSSSSSICKGHLFVFTSPYILLSISLQKLTYPDSTHKGGQRRA